MTIWVGEDRVQLSHFAILKGHLSGLARGSSGLPRAGSRRAANSVSDRGQHLGGGKNDIQHLTPGSLEGPGGTVQAGLCQTAILSIPFVRLFRTCRASIGRRRQLGWLCSPVVGAKGERF